MQIIEEQMNLTVHRGTHQIGGTCISITDGPTRLILDVGSPLDVDLGKKDLETAKKYFPNVKGLFQDSKERTPSTVLITHSHPDHTAFLDFLQEGNDVYMSETTNEMMKVIDLFTNWDGKPKVKPRIIKSDHRIPGRDERVGNFIITAYDVDHSAPGAVAYVIRHAVTNKTIVYTGDIRAHGKKFKLFPMFIKACPKKPDILITEGTMVGGDRDGVEETEDELKKRITEELIRQKKPVLTNFSLTNGDRIICLLSACIDGGYEFVIDLPTAFIYKKFEELNWKIKPFKDMPFKVFILEAHQRALADKGYSGFVESIRDKEVAMEDVFTQNNRLVLFKESQLGHFKRARKIPPGSLLIMSKWWQKPYPGQEISYENYMTFVRKMRLKLDTTFHVSGHAYTKDLKTLAESINPKMLIPIHTNSPDAFKELLPGLNVRVLTDNETITI